MKNKKIYIILALLVVCIGLLYYWLNDNEQEVLPEPVKVENELQKPEILTDTIPPVTHKSEKKADDVKPSRVKTLQSKKPVMEAVLSEELYPSADVTSPLALKGSVGSHVIKEEITVDSLSCLAIENAQRGFDWKGDTLAIKRGVDLLRIKRIGRFDRGIVNYRFMPKGKWIFGADFSFWDFNSEDSKLLFSYLDDFDFEARTISVSPFLGYFIKDNQAVGLKFGYKHTDGYLGNISLKIDDDVNFDLKELRLNEDMYNFTFFHTSYIGLDADKRFGLFNETNLRLGFGHSEFERGMGESLKNTKTNIFEAQLGINPGVAVFIMQNVSVECSVGVIGLKYRKESQRNNLGETGSHTNGGANFKINLFDINLGLTISM